MSLIFLNGVATATDSIVPHNTFVPSSDILLVRAGRQLPSNSVILFLATLPAPDGWSDYAAATAPATLKYIIKL